MVEVFDLLVLLLLLAVPTMFRYFYERALEGCFYKNAVI